jgi:hypothetical protein
MALRGLPGMGGSFRRLPAGCLRDAIVALAGNYSIVDASPDMVNVTISTVALPALCL